MSADEGVTQTIEQLSSDTYIPIRRYAVFNVYAIGSFFIVSSQEVM